MPTSSPAAIALLEHQQALITRSQLGALDGGLPLLRRMLRTGSRVRLDAGLYGPAGMPMTWHRKLMASLHLAPAGAVASHRAHAFLMGIGGFDVRDLRHAHGVTSEELLRTYLRHKRQGRNGGGALRGWLDRYFEVDGAPESGLEQKDLHRGGRCPAPGRSRRPGRGSGPPAGARGRRVDRHWWSRSTGFSTGGLS